MLSLFSDMVECFLKIFIDDFWIYGDSFEQFLHNFELVLQQCAEKSLTLNWEKCHFIVKHEIILEQISRKEIEVDKTKIDVIAKLPKPKCVKDIRSFLGHAEFYRTFIKDFSMIVRPLTNLLLRTCLSLLTMDVILLGRIFKRTYLCTNHFRLVKVI